MTLAITDTSLTRNQKRAIVRFFERAWENNEYAVRARRERWNRYQLVCDVDAELPEANPHRLVRRAMLACGKTFYYRIDSHEPAEQPSRNARRRATQVCDICHRRRMIVHVDESPEGGKYCRSCEDEYQGR